jgi:hypothetical protein
VSNSGFALLGVRHHQYIEITTLETEHSNSYWLEVNHSDACS